MTDFEDYITWCDENQLKPSEFKNLDKYRALKSENKKLAFQISNIAYFLTNQIVKDETIESTRTQAEMFIKSILQNDNECIINTFVDIAVNCQNLYHLINTFVKTLR